VRARAAAVALSTGAARADESRGVRLLSDIRMVFDSRKADRLFSADLAAALCRIEEAPWGALRAGALNASLDGAGLAPALQDICAAYHDRLGVTVDAILDDVTVTAPVEHALLRITQEACTNAVRHGGARRLTVSMSRQDGHVELAVRDTGTGFDPAAPHAGSGLAHIRDRVAELGGTVDIDSAPGRGAALTIRVPVP